MLAMVWHCGVNVATYQCDQYRYVISIQFLNDRQSRAYPSKDTEERRDDQKPRYYADKRSIVVIIDP